jgi:hypothetical protein
MTKKNYAPGVDLIRILDLVLIGSTYLRFEV